MSQTKLEKIKEIKSRIHIRRQYDGEDWDVAVAWLKNEVTYKAISKFYNRQGSSIYGLLACALKDAVIKGKIKVIKL